MDTIHLEMHGVCMKSRSMRMTRTGAEAVLQFCREYNVNVYRLFDSPGDVRSLLPAGEHVDCLEECYMYCNDKPDVYAYINDRQVKTLDFGLFQNFTRHAVLDDGSDEHVVIEKAAINDGIMVFEDRGSHLGQLNIQDIRLPIKRSLIDNSLLFNEVYHGHKMFNIKLMELSPGAMQAINVRSNGQKISFIDFLNSVSVSGWRAQNMISEISRTIQ